MDPSSPSFLQIGKDKNYYESTTLPLTGPPAPATLPGRAPDFSFQNEEVLLVPELVAELVWLVRSGIAAGTAGQLDSWTTAGTQQLLAMSPLLLSYDVMVFETLRFSSCLTFHSLA